jgi:UDP-2,3-diacylglucosamine pyrophosphatase LpxH
MLVIISDLHLGDGTAADSIPASAFYLFAKRLRQDAHFASISDGKYKPIKNLDVILMGDILDPLHSTRWLFSKMGGDESYTVNERREKKYPPITEQGETDYIRPWSDWKDPRFAAKLKEVTLAVLEHNQEGLQVFRDLAAGKTISFDADDGKGGRLADEAQKQPLQVNFYYMVGNHDWYYHLPGSEFDEIRKIIKDAMGLCNQPDYPFPYDLSKDKPESHSKYSKWKTDINEGNKDAEIISDLTQQYKVFARHGDYYDMFNFDIENGRDQATLGDAFTMEVCNRFPSQVLRTDLFKQDNPKSLQLLRQITNIRPALATSLWVTGQLKRLSQDITYEQYQYKEGDLNDIKAFEREAEKNEAMLKEVWDDLTDKFLNLEFVRNKDKWGIDIVDKMQAVIKLSKAISATQLDDLVYLVQSKNAASHDRSFAQFALKEPAFLDNSARYIVYGHTHHHETIPLDYDEGQGPQVYFNSGTWHTYFDLARKNPKEKKFVPYKALTYVTFFKSSEDNNPDVEHGEQNFETWSGAYA